MVRAYWRFVKAFFQFLPLAIAFARDRNKYIVFGPKRKKDIEDRRRRAERLKDTLVDLGPTYIKLGQLLSTRPDIMPQVYIDELIELQDDVPPEDYEHVRRIIREDIGDPDRVFDSFERDAISGASLGQVHIAHYRGRKLAVKVRRPDVEELVEADLRVLKFFLPIAQKFVEEAHAESMQGLADDFERRINQEMDYNRERRMLNEIKSNFEGDRRVVIPGTYDDICSKRVLAMEYHGGIKISEVDKLKRMGFDTEQLAKDLEKIYLQQSLVDGVFHGDPHPGNLAVNEKGQIVIYDFGMSGRISPSLQQSFIDFYLAAANRDPDGVIDAMIEMGTLDRDVDRDIMRDVIEIAIQDLSGEDVDDLRIQQLIDEVEETVYEYPLRIPSYVALGLRVSTIVEGVCVELDPEFDFLAVAREFFIEEGYVQKQVRGRMAQAWEDMKDTVASIARTPSKFETGLDKLGRDDIEVVVDVEDSKEHIEKLGKRISYAIVGASAVIGSTILTMSSRAAEYALPMFGFGLLILYLVRRSFKKEKKVMGPKTYATRHQAEKMQEKEEGEGVSPEREEELEEGRTYGDLNTGR